VGKKIAKQFAKSFKWRRKSRQIKQYKK